MKESFRHDQRQSAWGIAFLLARYFRGVVRQWWPLFLVMVVKPSTEKTAYFLLAMLGAALVMLVVAGIRHYHYRFRVEEGQLVIRQGWLQRSRTTIPLDRIQAVNLEQTLLHRVTHTARVMVETAGASGAEVTMGALPLEQAEQFREALFLDARTAAPQAFAPSAAVAPEEQRLLDLGFFDLLKIGLSQNHLRTIGLVLLVALNLTEELQNNWALLSEERLDQVGELAQSMMVMGALAVLALAAVVVGSIGRIMLRYADLVLLYDGHRFRLQSGLLTIREILISGKKLQYLTGSRNPLQRFFGLHRLSFAQAVPETASGQREVMIPGMYRTGRDAILRLVFPAESRELICEGGVAPPYRWYRWLWMGLIPGTVVGLFLYGQHPWLGLAGPIWWIWSWLAATRRAQHWRWYLGPDLLLLRHGWLTRAWELIPVYKIQSVSLHQSPWQRRFSLHTLTLHTAAGSESIPWMKARDAQMLRDWCLYRMESDRRPWM
jgi:putative membrane protein